MTRQIAPDRDDCPGILRGVLDPLGEDEEVCFRRHWEANNSEPNCSIYPDGVFDLVEKLWPLRQGHDTQQPTAGYTALLVQLVADLLQTYRRDIDATQLLRRAREGYLAWKETTVEGQRHVDHWDDLLQRETNERKKEADDKAIAEAQSGPRAVEYLEEYVQKPFGVARFRPKAVNVPQ